MLPLTELEQRLGYKFKNQSLLRRAVTHSSFGAEHNERLEFLGDSVLSCIVAFELFRSDTQFTEGVLTQARSNLVRDATLIKIAKTLKLDEFLLLGNKDIREKGIENTSIMADAMEAVFGAVFCDGGFEAAHAVAKSLYESPLGQVVRDVYIKDAKSILNEVLQARKLELPVYNVVETKGPPHDRVFTVSLTVPGVGVKVTGSGKSIQQAEKDAAHNALQNEQVIKAFKL